MTDFEIRSSRGKVRTVARVKAKVSPGDSRGALRVLEDECDRRRLRIDEHTIRGWDQRTGWIDHGGTT